MATQTTTRTPQGYFSIWQRLFRGYGPLLVFALLIALIAVLVPSKAPKATLAAGGGDVGAGSIPAGGGPAQAATGIPASGGGGGGSSSSGGTTGGPSSKSGGSKSSSSAPGVVTQCGTRAQQVPNDPYSPPCISFSGNNGGTTSKGVTGTDIHIAYRVTQDKGFQQTLAELAGANLQDTPADIQRTITALAQYFNTHYQFYGRKIVVDYYNGQGALTNELLGNGQAQADADALTVGQQMKSFGDLSAQSEPYADALSRQGVVGFGDPYMSQAWHIAHAPYIWSIAADGTKVASFAAEYEGKKLCPAGSPAKYAGGAQKDKPRKFASLAPENSFYQESVQVARKIVQSYHCDPGENVEYQLDLSTMSNQAANIISKLQSDGVTTILCGCDPIIPVFLSGVAARQNYFPEFVITGTALTDQDVVGQLWNQQFASHAFGISPNSAPVPSTQTLGYAAYKTVRPDEPAFGVELIYYQMAMMAIGIQMAGPNLTPQTFQQGMRAYPAREGPAGLWSFGQGNFTIGEDVREICWSPTQISGYNQKQGAYLGTSNQRWTIGNIPTGPVGCPRSGLVSAALDRWRELSSRARVVAVLGAIVVIYVLALVATGPHGVVHHRAPIGIILVGVVFGSVTAVGAMGLILIYRANRFINFAHGALGSLVGVIAIGMVKKHGVNYWVALPAAVVAGAVLGALIEFAVIRRFHNATRLILTVASIGLAQVLGGLELKGSNAIGFVSLTGGFKAPINVSLKLDVYTFHGDELLMVIAVPLVIVFLAWFLLKTDAGIAVRAAAENHDRALLFGIPVRRLATIVWLIAGGLTALAFMLQAPFSGVKPGLASNGPTQLLPLLAAAVVARMESLPMALGAGIGLGIMEQLVRWNSPGAPSFVYAAYLIIIVAALLLQRGKLSRAEESGDSTWSATAVVKPIPEELRRLPEVRWTKAALIAITGIAFVVVPHMWGASNQLLAGFAIVWAMIAVSLVILTGWGGHISLGQFGIAGIGAMVAGNLVARWNTDFLLVILASAVTGAIVALLVGLPALRIRGLFLAVTTLAFALALDQYFLNKNTFPKLIPDNIDRPLLLQRFDLERPYVMYATCIVFLALSILIAYGVRKARAGRVLIASRDNQRAADSAAVPTTAVKLSGFILAGSIAGVAGALDVFLLHALSPGAFPPADSITVFSFAVIGGLGSITGALIGVLIFKFLESLTWLGSYRLLLDGTALLVVLLTFPGGLGQLFFAARDRLLRRIADRRGILVPSLVADKRTEDEDEPADETDLLEGALEPVGATGP